eukprot:2282182-Prymnesium_polylepis.1
MPARSPRPEQLAATPERVVAPQSGRWKGQSVGSFPAASSVGRCPGTRQSLPDTRTSRPGRSAAHSRP